MIHSKTQVHISACLLIYPSPNYEEQVVCRLIAVRLDKAHSYEALSYHLGHSTHDQPILVNGRQKLITKPLLLALKDLRRPFLPRILWADGLCINQSEEAVEERNAQLFQMRTVSSQASQVMARHIDPDLDFWTMFKLFESLEKARNPEVNMRDAAKHPRHRKQSPRLEPEWQRYIESLSFRGGQEYGYFKK